MHKKCIQNKFKVHDKEQKGYNKSVHRGQKIPKVHKKLTKVQIRLTK